MARSRIVAATGTASRSDGASLSRNIELAMANAVQQAAADGITDPAKVKERMMAARENALKEAEPKPATSRVRVFLPMKQGEWE